MSVLVSCVSKEGCRLHLLFRFIGTNLFLRFLHSDLPEIFHHISLFKEPTFGFFLYAYICFNFKLRLLPLSLTCSSFPSFRDKSLDHWFLRLLKSVHRGLSVSWSALLDSVQQHILISCIFIVIPFKYFLKHCDFFFSVTLGSCSYMLLNFPMCFGFSGHLSVTVSNLSPCGRRLTQTTSLPWDSPRLTSCPQRYVPWALKEIASFSLIHRTES